MKWSIFVTNRQTLHHKYISHHHHHHRHHLFISARSAPWRRHCCRASSQDRALIDIDEIFNCQISILLILPGLLPGQGSDWYFWNFNCQFLILLMFALLPGVLPESQETVLIHVIEIFNYQFCIILLFCRASFQDRSLIDIFGFFNCNLLVLPGQGSDRNFWKFQSILHLFLQFGGPPPKTGL